MLLPLQMNCFLFNTIITQIKDKISQQDIEHVKTNFRNNLHDLVCYLFFGWLVFVVDV